MKTLTPSAAGSRATEFFTGHADLTAGAIRLGPHDVRAFDGRQARAVYCAGGAVWVTQDGLGQDVVLRAGEEFLARTGGGKLVVQPLTPAATIAVTFRAR